MCEIKVFEAKKGRGKAAVIKRITVQNGEGLRTLGLLLYFGWSVKEVKQGAAK